MSFGMNNWNNNQQVRDRMESDALEYQMREDAPQQAKKDLISRMSVRDALLILTLLLLLLLVRGM